MADSERSGRDLNWLQSFFPGHVELIRVDRQSTMVYSDRRDNWVIALPRKLGTAPQWNLGRLLLLLRDGYLALASTDGAGTAVICIM